MLITVLDTGVDGDCVIGKWMRELKPRCRQHQPRAVEIAGDEAIQVALAIVGISDDGVADMLQMAANLMSAATFWARLDQREAHARVASERDRQFDRCQRLQICYRRLRRHCARVIAIAVAVVAVCQGVIDRHGGTDVSSNDGNIVFAHSVGFKQPGQTSSRFVTQSKDQHTGRWFVEPMYRIYVLADLIAQHLHGKACFVAIYGAAMHQQSRWLVDCDEVLIFVKYLQHDRRIHDGTAPRILARVGMSHNAGQQRRQLLRHAGKMAGGDMKLPVVGIDHIVLRAIDMKSMLHFYCDVLGCTIERTLDIGLVQLRAGSSLIDLVPVDSELGRKGGAAPAREALNLDHVCLLIEPFDESRLREHFLCFGIDLDKVDTRYGATGFGPSIYLRDPQGNTVELKGRGPQ